MVRYVLRGALGYRQDRRRTVPGTTAARSGVALLRGPDGTASLFRGGNPCALERGGPVVALGRSLDIWPGHSFGKFRHASPPWRSIALRRWTKRTRVVDPRTVRAALPAKRDRLRAIPCL